MPDRTPACGYTARLKRHGAQIQSICEAVIEAAALAGASGNERISAANEALPDGTGWIYRQDARTFAELGFDDLQSLSRAHEEVLKALEAANAGDATLAEMIAKEQKLLARMLWLQELAYRGEDPLGSHQVDIDPLSLRLVAALADTAEGDYLEDQSGPIFEMSELKITSNNPSRQSREKAAKLIRNLVRQSEDSYDETGELEFIFWFERSGDAMISELRLFVENGTASCAFSPSSKNWSISSYAVTLQMNVTETIASALHGQPIERLIDHPAALGLGIILEQRNTLSIFAHNGWTGQRTLVTV
ncbi:hypothetical protein [Croceicoccus gelatinilyticus]|uniref:hypothetical protein n=1 Tax=Croceicoccus gelatinilyticus TaxID=2835536 RepID=UPI001BCE57F2|nr:hypothetical protein [Croceicoccus gelatinilyticus]MBS7671711.1 hypothetical protein [Croceicoccus gelatinilyticus]